jgi:hypothetical protein
VKLGRGIAAFGYEFSAARVSLLLGSWGDLRGGELGSLEVAVLALGELWNGREDLGWHGRWAAGLESKEGVWCLDAGVR